MIIYYVLTMYANTHLRKDIFGSACMRLIEALHNIQDYSLKGLTKICYVSNSTISRLTKKLFYVNLNQFTGYLQLAKKEYAVSGSIVEKTDSYLQAQDKLETNMMQAIQNIKQILNEQTMQQITTLIHQANRICIVGFPVPESAYSLQMELNMQGKKTCAYMDPRCQLEEIHEYTKNDLIIMYEGIADEDSGKDVIEQNQTSSLIVISPYQKYKKIYNARVFIPYEQTNFTMNLFKTSVITDFIITAVQATK